MKIANQADIDNFIQKAMFDKDIYPYLSASKYFEHWIEQKNDWEGVIITNTINSYMVKIRIDRTRDCEFNIALYATNAIAAGQGLRAIQYLIDKYKPRAINSAVHGTNKKSMILNTRVFGQYWGKELKSAWDSGLGEYVDMYYFRKLL